MFQFLLLLFCSLSEGAPQPNIVFIVADDYGFHDIGYHGSEINTPNLDKLSAQGVRLENYYVQPICTPSRSQLLSGRYQIHTGLQHAIIWPCQPNALPLDHPTMADRLREAGYSTHAVGKWHLGFYMKKYMPTNRGFDSYYGYLTGSEDYYTRGRGYNGELGHSVFNKQIHGTDMRNNMEPDNSTYGEYSAHVYTRRAQQIIESSVNETKPLFLYVPFQSVHSPMQVPAQYKNQYLFIKNHTRRTYAGMVAALDEAVGNITATLKSTGMWENTILVFTTDNGGQAMAGGSNFPLRGNKGTYWEGGVHGIGFVASPLIAPSKYIRISKELIHITDWYPTLVKLAGGTIDDLQLDGFDVWNSIINGTSSPRMEILHNIDPLYTRKGNTTSPVFDTSIQAAYRYRDYKLLTGDPGWDDWFPEPNLVYKYDFNKTLPVDPTKNVYLFNIREDPEERNDLSETHDGKLMVKLMLERLSNYNKTAVPVRYPPNDYRCDPALHGGFWGPWM